MLLWLKMRPAFYRIRNGLRLAGFTGLVGILFGLVPVFAGPTGAGLVYCPLQRAWVKKAGEILKAGPLKNICASDEAKQKFSFESFRKLGSFVVSLDETRIEKLFFDYSKAGSVTLTGLKPVNAPERQSLTGSDESETIVANGRPAIDRAAPQQAVSLQLALQRAPKIAQKLTTNYYSRIPDGLSRPRAPPLSL